MTTLIRLNAFETNSSSSHCIVIDKNNHFLEKANKLLTRKKDKYSHELTYHLNIKGDEYLWSDTPKKTVKEKLNYVIASLSVNNEDEKIATILLKLLRSIIEENKNIKNNLIVSIISKDNKKILERDVIEFIEDDVLLFESILDFIQEKDLYYSDFARVDHESTDLLNSLDADELVEIILDKSAIIYIENDNTDIEDLQSYLSIPVKNALEKLKKEEKYQKLWEELLEQEKECNEKYCDGKQKIETMEKMANGRFYWNVKDSEEFQEMVKII